MLYMRKQTETLINKTSQAIATGSLPNIFWNSRPQFVLSPHSLHVYGMFILNYVFIHWIFIIGDQIKKWEFTRQDSPVPE